MAEAEAADAARRVEEAQKISIRSMHDLKDEKIKDVNAAGLEDKVPKNLAPSSQRKIIGSPIRKSYSSDRSENNKITLKLVDGNVDNASVIKEGHITQSHPNRCSTVNKNQPRDSSVSKVSNSKSTFDESNLTTTKIPT